MVLPFVRTLGEIVLSKKKRMWALQSLRQASGWGLGHVVRGGLGKKKKIRLFTPEQLLTNKGKVRCEKKRVSRGTAR